MELTPATGGGGSARTSNNALIAAECRCPPGTAQYHDSTSCYKLYEQGPCDIGQYFAPVNEPKNTAIMYVVHGCMCMCTVLNTPYCIRIKWVKWIAYMPMCCAPTLYPFDLIPVFVLFEF